MNKILNFSIIGTNPKKYFDNYVDNLNYLSKGAVLELDKKSHSIIHDGYSILKFNSDSTFRQNIDTWVCFGFFIRNQNGDLIKVLNKGTTNFLMNHVKYILFVEDEDEMVNMHRQTILLKLLNKFDNKILEKFELQSQTKIVPKESVDSETGKFEEELYSDKNYIKIVIEYLNQRGIRWN